MPRRYSLKRFVRFRLRTIFLIVTAAAVLLAIAVVPWYRSYLQDLAIHTIQEMGGITLGDAEGHTVRVYLAGAKLGDKELKELAPHLNHLPDLNELDLVRAPISDEGLAHLEMLTRLKTLYVFETGVTKAGIAKLQQELPDLTIKLEEPDPVATKLAATNIYRHAITSVAVLDHGDQLLTGSGDGKLRSWDAPFDGRHTIVDAHKNWLFGIATSPDVTLIATGGGDNLVKLWDAKSLREVARLEGHADDVPAVAFSPDGTVLYSAGDDMSVRSWDVRTRTERQVLGYHAAQIPCLAVAHGSGLVATGSRDNTIRIWSAAGQVLCALEGHTDDVMSVAFHPDGQILASASYDNTIRLWNATTGDELRRLDGHEGRAYTVAFNADGSMLASGGADGVIFWRTDCSDRLRQVSGMEHVACVMFGPEHGHLLAANAEGIVYSIDSATGRLRRIASTSRVNLRLQ